MAPQSPSIRSFFQPSTSADWKKDAEHVRNASSPAPEPGDGFTAAEVDTVRHASTNETWTPVEDYEDVDISSLVAGLRRVSFMGRVVNLFDQSTPSKTPRAAKGCIKIIVKDDAGKLMVRLWYANAEYRLRFGDLVTIWTAHIANGERGSLAPSSAPLFTSIFPERDRSCHIMIHEQSDEGAQCRTPLGYRRGQQLTGLMTLKNFVDSGYDITDGRILVCVKSIGVRKTFTSRKNTTSELVNVCVFDDTAEATLTLWGCTASSAALWKASSTVLLISNPGWRIDHRAWISLTSDTCVEVDPCISDADWLRGFAQGLTKREHVSPPFPEEVFDTEAAANSEVRVLYTLADVDDARAAPRETFAGYLSVVVMEVNILLLYRRSNLMCTECCGVPLYANATIAECKQCEKTVPLSINPRLLGTLVDETGSTTTGQLILSPPAWEQLLGRTAEELVSSSIEVLGYLEQRLLFLRTTLLFGWAAVAAGGGVGRLCIWGVRM